MYVQCTTERNDTMAKAKYKQNSRGEWETKIWDGTYNADGSTEKDLSPRNPVPT